MTCPDCASLRADRDYLRRTQHRLANRLCQAERLLACAAAPSVTHAEEAATTALIHEFLRLDKEATHA